MIRSCIVLFLLSAVSLGDTVVTSTEAIECQVVRADSMYTRLKLPGGGIRMLMTEDIYEMQISDSARMQTLSEGLPNMRIGWETDQPAPSPQAGAKEIGPGATESASVTRPDPIPAGGFMLGGSIGFSSTSVNDVTTTNLTIAPSLAYFVLRGFGIGLDLSLYTLTTGSVSATSSAIGPKAVLVLGPRGGSSFFLGEASIALTDLEVGSDAETTGRRTTISIGFLPVVGGNLGIPFKLSVLFDAIGEVETTTWQLGMGLTGLFYPMSSQ